MRETMNNDQDVLEIDLQKLLMVYLHNWKMIVASTLLVALVTMAVTMNFITPLYKAGVTIYVNNSLGGQQVDIITGSNLSASQQLVNTYTSIMKSDMILERVIANKNLDMTPEQLLKKMTTSQVDKTELFRVYITDANPAQAAEIANAMAEITVTDISEFVEGSSVKVVDYAKVPEKRDSPSYSRNTILGALVGCMLAVAFVTVRYLMDVRIKSEEDLTQRFTYPVLGQVPAFTQNGKNKKQK